MNFANLLKHGDTVTIQTAAKWSDIGQGELLVNYYGALEVGKKKCVEIPDIHKFEIFKFDTTDPIIREGDQIYLKSMQLNQFATFQGPYCGTQRVLFNMHEPFISSSFDAQHDGANGTFTLVSQNIFPVVEGAQRPPVYTDGTRSYGILNTRARCYVSADRERGVRSAKSLNITERFLFHNVLSDSCAIDKLYANVDHRLISGHLRPSMASPGGDLVAQISGPVLSGDISNFASPNPYSMLTENQLYNPNFQTGFQNVVGAIQNGVQSVFPNGVAGAPAPPTIVPTALIFPTVQPNKSHFWTWFIIIVLVMLAIIGGYLIVTKMM